MRHLPEATGEGLTGYPRWEGVLTTTRTLWVIAAAELKRAWDNTWSRFAILLVLAYSIVFLGTLFQAGQGAGTSVHTVDTAVSFLDTFRWAALGLAAIVGGPTLLEDRQLGALELYYSRAATRLDYLGGKVLAVLGLTLGSMVVPALLYWGSSFLIFETHPDGWNLWFLRALAYSLAWSVPIAGLGLGLSAVGRNARGATLILFGGVAAIDIVVKNLLEGLTRNTGKLEVLSPFSAHRRIAGTVFAYDDPLASALKFPEWWALLGLLALAVVGWGLVAWKHPRIAGVE